MRITKRIEDYIYKQVENKIHASASLAQLKEKSDAAKERYLTALNAIKQTAKESFEALLREMGIPYNGSTELSMHVYFDPMYRLPECCTYREAKENLTRKAHDIAKDIIVSMEMGGDKEQLTKMLEEITFE